MDFSLVSPPIVSAEVLKQKTAAIPPEAIEKARLFMNSGIYEEDTLTKMQQSFASANL
jgi:hypothetical protein